MKGLRMRHASLIGLCAATAMLSACAGVPAGGLGPAPLTPTQRFTLQVEPGIERIALAVRDHGLSPNQQAAVVDLANRFAMEGAPVMRVEVPSGEDAVAADMGWRVKAYLEQIGVEPHRVEVVGYPAPDPRAPVVIGYESLRASVPQCGAQWTNLTRTARNETQANFGCAVTANLAAQIANPRDIIQPRAMTPVDSGRRAVVFDNYRTGEATAATREQLLSNQQVSQAVQ
jgi:pilus assembly protein CpaD